MFCITSILQWQERLVDAHAEKASGDGCHAWLHYSVSCIESCPVLGLLACAVEEIFRYFCGSCCCPEEEADHEIIDLTKAGTSSALIVPPKNVPATAVAGDATAVAGELTSLGHTVMSADTDASDFFKRNPHLGEFFRYSDNELCLSLFLRKEGDDFVEYEFACFSDMQGKYYLVLGDNTQAYVFSCKSLGNEETLDSLRNL